MKWDLLAQPWSDGNLHFGFREEGKKQKNPGSKLNALYELSLFNLYNSPKR